MKSIRAHRRFQLTGFTLLEMVLVLSVIAILVATSIHLLIGVPDTAKRARAQMDVDKITTALATYRIRSSMLPTPEQGLSALVAFPTAPPPPRSWGKQMVRLPIDPWGNPYQYRRPGPEGLEFEVFSLGEDGVESEDDVRIPL